MGDQVTGLFSPLLRSARLNESKKHCQGIVLDYGCGTGEFSVFFDESGYVGVDSDCESVETARKRFPTKSFYVLEESGWRSRMFDTIVMCAVMEHLKDPEGVISGFRPLLNVPGRIVITSPNPRFEFVHTIGSRLRVFSPEAANEHCTKIDSARIRSLTDKVGMRVVVDKHFLFGFNQCFVLETGDVR